MGRTETMIDVGTHTRANVFFACPKCGGDPLICGHRTWIDTDVLDAVIRRHCSYLIFVARWNGEAALATRLKGLRPGIVTAYRRALRDKLLNARAPTVGPDIDQRPPFIDLPEIPF